MHTSIPKPCWRRSRVRALCGPALSEHLGRGTGGTSYVSITSGVHLFTANLTLHQPHIIAELHLSCHRRW